MPDFTGSPARHPLLSRPISVYSIPPELLDVLTVRSIRSTPVDALNEDEQQQDQTEQGGRDDADSTLADAGNLPSGSSLTCQTCLGVSFVSLGEQRAHFKSDWHRYNAKVSMDIKGGVAGSKRGVLTAEEFEEINDGESMADRVMPSS